MTHLSRDEAKAQYEKMGEALGSQFSALWQEVAWLHMKWGEFVELFGTSSERVDLLNQAAPSFFHLIQDTLWENTLLHLTRLTDSPKSVGKPNLTIQNLPELATNSLDKVNIQRLVDIARDKTEFCRDWRNRHIAHRDLDLALGGSASPLKAGSRQSVKEALTAIADVLNAVERIHMRDGTHFTAGTLHGGAISLLRVLDDGVRAGKRRMERLNKGQLTEEDFPRTL